MTEVVVFGSGCFWCTEAVFKIIKGVKSVTSGYAGGSADNPSYEDVLCGDTGHAEVVKVEYDPKVVTFRQLLSVFFGSHDPTTKNRQGADVGPQYRSIILYNTPDQEAEAKKVVAEINASSSEGKPIVTEIRPLDKFYEAEEYHKDYYTKNPENAYCEIVINPKLEKVKTEFAELLKSQ